MGTAEQLAAFVELGLTQFPADRYALSIWDHGGGWTGIGPDETDGHDVLDLADITSGLEQGLAAAGVERLDLLGFDACLMATYEVASALAPYADHLLASEELEPGHGWDYRSLQVLADDPSTDAATLGSDVHRRASPARPRSRAPRPRSRCRCSTSRRCPRSTRRWPCSPGSSRTRSTRWRRSSARSAPTAWTSAATPTPRRPRSSPTSGVLVSEIGVASLQVSDAADAVLTAIGDVVLDRTAGPARSGATGLSIYFPPRARAAPTPTTAAFPPRPHGPGSCRPTTAPATRSRSRSSRRSSRPRAPRP